MCVGVCGVCVGWVCVCVLEVNVFKKSIGRILREIVMRNNAHQTANSGLSILITKQVQKYYVIYKF